MLAGALLCLAVLPLSATEPFVPQPIPSQVLERITGGSLPADTTLMPPSELRYIELFHYGPDGVERRGEIIVNRRIAEKTARIFKRLHDMKYPIESIRLIDDFNADDEESMRANNSSAFCYRRVKGSKKLSKHSLGLAIDINPLYNPCIRLKRNSRGDSIGVKRVEPSVANPYIDRRKEFPMKITGPNDPLVILFRSEGFKWGGAWKSVKDYQHFEY